MDRALPVRAQPAVCPRPIFKLLFLAGIVRGVDVRRYPRPGGRLWHPWLRINRVLRVMLMLHTALERGGVSSGPRRVQEGARAAESDSGEGGRVLMACPCGAVLVRVVPFS
jgi:hypothetical protein